MLLWWEYGALAAIFAGILGVYVLGAQQWAKKHGQKWIAGALGTFMRNISEQAAEEGTEVATQPGAGSFKIGGLPIMEIVQLVSDPNIQKLIKGFIKPGGGGGSGW